MKLSRYWGIQVLNGCTHTDFQGPWTDYFSIKIYNQRLLSKAFKIEALEQRHECIPMNVWKASGAITTGFEVAIQVFDGRIVLRIFGVQKSSQTQTFSNKASILCPQGWVLWNITINLYIRDLESQMGHSVCEAKSVLGYSGPEWLYPHGFSRPLNGLFFDKNLPIKGCYRRLLRSKHWNKNMNSFQ